jgi:cytochrome c oxidase subunit 2
MIGKNRLRWLAKSAVTASLALALIACGTEYPNTTFAPGSELAENIDGIWDVLLLWGMIVFVLVELALIYIVIRFRHREGTPEPRPIHGNTRLEILWTLIPAIILLFIAVPTVRTIFQTQADPPANALQIEVRGNQWWWEFEYPEYGFKTANEIYIPAGRPVSLNIQTFNVLHSFWIPRLAGKRDAVNRRVNRIWFTVHDSLTNQVFNGSCTEFCGYSHGNMQFRVFVVSDADFSNWAAHMRTPAISGAQPVAGAAPGATGTAAATQAMQAQLTPGTQDSAATAAPAYEFPKDRVPAYAIPQTPYWKDVTVDESLTGDAARGRELFNYPLNLCIGCHTVAGSQYAQGINGPDLTHVASRTTIAGSMYPFSREILLRWVKNSPRMKPGSFMPTFEKGVVNPTTGQVGMLDDQQIADIVAYLMTLK